MLPEDQLVGLFARFVALGAAISDPITRLHEVLFLPPDHDEMDEEAAQSPWEALLASGLPKEMNGGPCILPAHMVEIVLYALHLLAQQWQLVTRRQSDAQGLAPILASLAAHLGLSDYLDAAIRNGASIAHTTLHSKPERPSR